MWIILSLSLYILFIQSPTSGHLGCFPSMLVVWPEAAPVLESTPSTVWLLANSKMIYVNMPLPGLLLPVSLSLKHAAADPLLFQRSWDTHRHVWLSLLWANCFIPRSWCPWDFVYALQKSLSYPVLWKSRNQILLAFKVRFPGNS